ncbi:MAG: flotillin [Planctomycetota bacterium]|jgi:flotillin
MSFTPFLAEGTFVADNIVGVTIVFGVLIIFGSIMVLARRYKRCPSNRILIVYGKTAGGRSAKAVHGGGTFVWPLIQNYDYLSLDPMQIETPLEGALSLENIRVSVPSVFTVAIGTENEQMNNAAVRLLGLTTSEIMKQAEDIIFGQLRQVIAGMRIEEINRDRDSFLGRIQENLEPELEKIGLILINVNIKDITDESGYIEAIGRKAASEAVQQALIDVAQQERHGSIGVAEAGQEREIRVAQAEKSRDIGTAEAERERAVRLADLEKEKIIGERQAAFEQEAAVKDAEREMRVRVASANAQAITGENESKAAIAATNAELQVREAEAFQTGESRRRQADAAVREAQYIAEAKAAEAEGTKREAETRASLESVAKAEKAQTIVAAEASAERQRILARGEADAIFAKLDAEARGNYEILAKKGLGLEQIVKSCGGAPEAFQLMMLEHIEAISETAATAISNIKFDKIVVWDGGQEGGGAGGFIKNLAGSLPPALQIMKDIGGVEMPEFIGKLTSDQPGKGAPKEGEDEAPAAEENAEAAPE